MNKVAGVTGLALILFASAVAAETGPSQIEFDHIWIMVSPNAPERAALQSAGFRISPDINRHDGQGTASITVEFQNAFLELMWPDSKVPVAPDLGRAAEKFRQRMLWRSSGLVSNRHRLPPRNAVKGCLAVLYVVCGCTVVTSRFGH
jgi:hypothetical protein